MRLEQAGDHHPHQVRRLGHPLSGVHRALNTARKTQKPLPHPLALSLYPRHLIASHHLTFHFSLFPSRLRLYIDLLYFHCEFFFFFSVVNLRKLG